MRLVYAAHQQAKTEMSIEFLAEMISAENETEIAAILIEGASDLQQYSLNILALTSDSAAGLPPLFL